MMNTVDDFHMKKQRWPAEDELRAALASGDLSPFADIHFNSLKIAPLQDGGVLLRYSIGSESTCDADEGLIRFDPTGRAFPYELRPN